MSGMRIFGDRHLEALTDAELREAGRQVCLALELAAKHPAVNDTVKELVAGCIRDFREVFAEMERRAQ